MASDGSTHRRAWVLASVLVAGLVFARSAVFLVYEQAFFDSDQAIVGLMAKHLIEGRAFPLFYYGQTYMLVVDAWVAVPFFLLLGPTVFALHLALLFLNAAVALLLVAGLVQSAGLRPWLAATAVTPFAFAPPLTTASLVEPGANIVPFLSVILLWMLRRRPLWFGVVLGIGVLNREFTVYALPPLLAIELWTGGWGQLERRRFWLVGLLVAVGTWQAVQLIKPYSDVMGPGTRASMVTESGGSPLGNIADRISFVPAELPSRTRVMFTEHLPALFGAKRMLDSISNQGRDWLFWPLAAGLAIVVVRLAVLARQPVRFGRATFAWYLAATGLLSAAAYIATRPADGVIFRYILLTLLIPVGLIGGYLSVERHRGYRGAVIGIVALWTAISAVDHAAQVHRYWGGREPNETRDLADGLVARGITVAESDYWRAYRVSFLTEERVKIASTDVPRIEEYQRLAREAGPGLVHITREPCPSGGEPLSLWYLCSGP